MQSDRDRRSGPAGSMTRGWITPTATGLESAGGSRDRGRNDPVPGSLASFLTRAPRMPASSRPVGPGAAEGRAAGAKSVEEANQQHHARPCAQSDHEPYCPRVNGHQVWFVGRNHALAPVRLRSRSPGGAMDRGISSASNGDASSGDDRPVRPHRRARPLVVGCGRPCVSGSDRREDRWRPAGKLARRWSDWSQSALPCGRNRLGARDRCQPGDRLGRLRRSASGLASVATRAQAQMPWRTAAPRREPIAARHEGRQRRCP